MLDDIKPSLPTDGERGSPPPHPHDTQTHNTHHNSFDSASVADESGSIPVAQIGHISHVSFKDRLFSTWHKLTKRKRILLLTSLVGLLIGGSVAGYFIFIKSDPPPAPVVIQEPEPEPEPEPTTKPSPLTGVEVAIKLAELPVTGIMIENSPEARPQSGLRDAGVVVEAVTEGGITRFLALFQESKPKTIGPVRSARTHFLDFVVPFDAALAHVGGSGHALNEISHQNIRSLNQFTYPGAYQRSNARYAPHNMYTSRQQLLEVHKQAGFNKSNFKGFLRKEPAPSKTPKASTINLNISSFNYNSSYNYHAESNTYRRTMANQPHMDETSGKRISPDVVVALVAKHSYAGIYSRYKIRGSGEVFVFQDGKVIRGTWHKANRSAELTFKTKSGEPLALNPGQTWITLADNAGQVTHSP
ncbi:MAG: DUF3048 domain-containing protein [Candidatus Saccharibacteria bacterium]|nr:DUF3048 domain-containing protein [Candidatus Saccharibacteria bacterium]